MPAQSVQTHAQGLVAKDQQKVNINISAEEIRFAANQKAVSQLLIFATVPKAFRQCAACANDHPFRFLQQLEINTPRPFD
jgi:hypothetical protein